MCWSRNSGAHPEYIFVVIDEVDTDNWGRKGQSLTDLWNQRTADRT